MSDKKIRRIKLNPSATNKKASSDALGEANSSGKAKAAMVKVKVEKQEPEDGLLVTCGIQRRKRLARCSPAGRKSRRIAELKDIVCFDSQKNKQPASATRWNVDRIKFAEQTLADVLKEKGASFEKPVSRHELRTLARTKIGDTGLLDHSLKHSDGNVTPGGEHRFRRCYNTDGTMEFWLESADLVKIKLESGIPDPNWVPPSWWKSQTSSHESSSKLLMGEIEKMKSDIKELVSNQKSIDHADATEKLSKDDMSWRVKTDKQIMDISKSLTSTQSMFKELISWKDKVEQQLTGISNSLNSLQANGSTSFSPAPESWEQILQSANLDDLAGNGFEPWDDLIDVLPDSVKQETYPIPPKPSKSPIQNRILTEEQSLVNVETQRTESCVTRSESRSSNQEKPVMTPGSSVTPGPKSDIDDPNIHSQENLKELVTWKAKAEQQLTEISKAVRALQGESHL